MSKRISIKRLRRFKYTGNVMIDKRFNRKKKIKALSTIRIISQ